LNCMARKTVLGIFFAGAFAVLLPGLLPADALAAGEISEGRKIYDSIMLWVNFGILAFFFIRYGKTPLMNFLQGERKRVQNQLHEIEEDLNLARQRMKEESDKLDGIDGYLKEIQARIVEMGKREKKKILDEARVRADQMIQEAENELGFQMKKAKWMLNDQLAQKAVDLARERLAAAFTDQDNDKHLQGIMDQLGQVKSDEDLRM